MPRPQPLILLPPSEGKATGGDGPPWATGTMADGGLDSHRRTVLRAATRAGAVGRRAPTVPAMERYTGVLYKELDWSTLPAAARRRGDAQVRVVSGLWGLVAPADPIPHYKLKMSARLEDLGRLSSWWRPRLAPVLAARSAGAVVWDLLPNEHEQAMDWTGMGPAQRITVRFVDAGGRTVSHWNKLLKGSLVRWLLTARPPGARGHRRLPAPPRLPVRPSCLSAGRAGRRDRAAPGLTRRLPRMSARAHFKIAGIPVHVQPVFFVIAGLFGLRYIDLGFDVVLIWVTASFVSILVHELGHGLTLKAFGAPSAIVLHGFGGVTISPRRAKVARLRGVVVSLAGSCTALLLLWLPARTYLHGAVASGSFYDLPKIAFYGVQFIAFQNLWWSIANLLPIRPLDGGNVTAEIFGLPAARRISIVAAVGGALWAFTHDQSYAGFFALFLAFNNWQEIRAEQSGAAVDVFHVDAPDAPGGGRRAGRRPLRSVPTVAAPMTAAPSASVDPARQEQLAWNALRADDGATARLLVDRMGRSAGRYLQASAALATGSPDAFELFEAAYVAEPGGPPNLVATELLARTGAAGAVARRLLARSDGKGREGAASLQTHLHYGGRYREAAEVGEAVFGAGPSSRAQTAFEVACSWARAGEVDLAADWLSRAADEGFKAASIVDGEPDLAEVRTDPRWPLLRARLT